MKKTIFSTASILSGTIIGAGIFGVPFVISKVGILPGILYLLGVAVINLLVFLLLGEVVERTKEGHQMSGLAEEYLGGWGKALMTFTILFGNLGAILVYMIGIGEFGFELLGPTLGGTPFLYSSLFFIVASLAVLVGLGMVVKFEQVMVVIIIGIVLFLAVIGFGEIRPQNIAYTDFSNIFLPFGVLLFAFGGMSAIPEMKRYIGDGKKLEKSIFLGLFFPLMVYIIFSLTVVGITGTETSQEAIAGLSGYLGRSVVILGSILGVLTMGTSFFTIGIITKSVLSKDFKLHPILAWVLTCFTPYIIYLLGLTSFIEVIALVGSITGGLYGIMAIVMYLKARKQKTQKPAFSIKLPGVVIAGLVGVFVLGIVYEILAIIGVL